MGRHAAPAPGAHGPTLSWPRCSGRRRATSRGSCPSSATACRTRPAPPAASDPETERRRLFVAVQRLVARLARQRAAAARHRRPALGRPLVAAARPPPRPRAALGPVLLVGTFRDTELDPGHPLPDLIADVERDRPVPRVRLGGMDEREVAALIGAWHGARGRGRRRARDPRRRPRATRSSSSSSCATSRRSGGDGRLAVDDGLGVPEGVRDVIARRVARLPERAGHVLRVAALIGRDFEYDLLERVADVPEPTSCSTCSTRRSAAALLAEVPRTPGPLLVRARAAALDDGGRALRDAARAAAPPHRRGDRAAPPRPARPMARRARAPLRRGRAARRSTAPSTTPSAPPRRPSDRLAYDEAVRLLEPRGGAAQERRRRSTRRSSRGSRPALARRRGRRRALGGGARELRPRRRRGAGRPRPARRSRAPRSATPAARSEQYGRDDTASVALLEEALDRLPAGDSRLRAQVLARLAVLRYHRSAPPRGGGASRPTPRWRSPAGSRTPRRSCTALGAAQYARWRPGRAEERLAVADELIALADARAARRSSGGGAPVAAGRAARALPPRRGRRSTIARYAEIAEQTQQFQLLRASRRAARDVRPARGRLRGGAAAAEEVLRLGRARRGATARRCRSCCPVPRRADGSRCSTSATSWARMVAAAPSRWCARSRGLPGWRRALAWAWSRRAGPSERARGAGAVARGRVRGAAARHQLRAGDGDGRSARHRRARRRRSSPPRAEPLLAPFRDLWVVVRRRRADARPGRVLARRARSSCRGAPRDAAATLRAGARAVGADARPARTSRARAPGWPPRCAGAASRATPPGRRSSPPWRPPTPASSGCPGCCASSRLGQVRAP